MKTIKLLSISMLIAFTFNAMAQLTWTQKADFYSVRTETFAFTIGNYGYVGNGTDGPNYNTDLFQWDPTNNTWTQKASMPSLGKAKAACFTIDSLGYTVGGATYSGVGLNSDETWSYSPTSNSWTQKVSYPTIVSGACAFVIGNYAYVGLGMTTVDNYFNTFYRFDPVGNSFTAIAPFPGNARCMAFAFTINGKGYVGAGQSYSGGSYIFYKDMWEYDPTTNSWTQKADFPPIARGFVAGWSINNIGYAGLGWNTPFNIFGDLWAYIPTNNTWQQMNTPDGFPRFAVGAFSIGNKGYVATGRVASSTYIKEFWEFLPAADIGINENKAVSVSSTISDNQLYLFGLAPLENIKSVQLIEPSGKLIKQWKYEFNSTYDVSGLTSGLYFVQLEMKHGIRVAKVLK
ncbi:MAG: kelch repeat-containing protein [Bacteroidota bacterium]